KEIAPHVARAAILFNPDAKAASWLAAAAAVAPRFAVEVIEAPVRDSNEIEAVMAQSGRQPKYGMIVLPAPATNAHRKLINELAARHRLPAIHALSGATRDGGLMSYGVDLPDVFRQAAAYADRILKGDKPADLPVQLPTKFELAINLKTAKALGLIVPNSLMVSAAEVIEGCGERGRSKMNLPRRKFLHLAASAAALPAVSRIARAQAYPSWPVRIIVGFPAGLGPDITARLIAQLLSERFNQSFVVDNRPGAGSNIGTEIVVRAPADGYTLLLMTASNAINATVYDNLNFDFIRDVA